MRHPVILVSDERMLGHETGAGHPERPDRLRAVTAALKSEAIEEARWIAPPLVDAEHVGRVHDPAYVERLASLRGQSAQLDPDTSMSPGSWDAAQVAAGAASEAVRAVCAEEGTRAFALVRPPGHHAERARAMGFCLLNNVALAAELAIHDFGCERVLIVDWDVHHGNGTQAIFDDRADVLLFSTHQSPCYPGTGAADEVGRGDGRGFTVNVPLPPGLGDPDHLAVFDRLLTPIAASYDPDLFLVSAGFDAHREDPLAQMEVTEAGFAALCEVVTGLADRHAEGRLALVLEGGYDLGALSRSVVAVTRVLAGQDAKRVVAEPGEAALRAIDRARAVQLPFWKFD